MSNEAINESHLDAIIYNSFSDDEKQQSSYLQQRAEEKRLLVYQVTDLIASYGDYLPLSDLVAQIKPMHLKQWIIDTGNHPRTWGASQ